MNNKDIYTQAIEKFGESSQLLICVEELSELSAMVARSGRTNRQFVKSDLVFEMADVLMCISTLQKLFNVSDVELWAARNEKEKKLRKYLEQENI